LKGSPLILLSDLKNYFKLSFDTILTLKFQKVYHAHWIGENTNCVALKVYYSLDGYRNELDVLEYLNRIDVSERDHIIKMLG